MNYLWKDFLSCRKRILVGNKRDNSKFHSTSLAEIYHNFIEILLVTDFRILEFTKIIKSVFTSYCQLVEYIYKFEPFLSSLRDSPQKSSKMNKTTKILSSI